MSAPRIVILGSGFAALTAVRELRRRCVGAVITIVSPAPVLTYLPSLIWVPAGLRRAEDLTIPSQASSPATAFATSLPPWSR